MVTKRKAPQDLLIKRFSPAEDALITEMFEQNKSDPAIAAEIKSRLGIVRNPQCIKGRRSRVLNLAGPKGIHCEHRSKKTRLLKPSPWTPKKIEKLRKVWARLLTIPREDCGDIFSACADEMEMSRNQVAGKIHRLHLPTRAGSDRSYASDVRRRPRPRRNASRPRKSHVLQLTEESAEQPTETAVSILNLERIDKTQELINDVDVCHWPVGEPSDLKFCGGKCTRIVMETDEEGNVLRTKPSPYCGYHTRLAYKANSQPRSKHHGTSKGITEPTKGPGRFGRVNFSL